MPLPNTGWKLTWLLAIQLHKACVLFYSIIKMTLISAEKVKQKTDGIRKQTADDESRWVKLTTGLLQPQHPSKHQNFWAGWAFLTLECRGRNTSGEQSWLLSLDMICYQRSCLPFVQRSLVTVFSAFLVADGPAPPLHAKTNGQNVAFSTSVILCSCLLFLVDSWYL